MRTGFFVWASCGLMLPRASLTAAIAASIAVRNILFVFGAEVFCSFCIQELAAASSAGPARAPRRTRPPSPPAASSATAATQTTADTPATSARRPALACAPWPRGSCSAQRSGCENGRAGGGRRSGEAERRRGAGCAARCAVCGGFSPRFCQPPSKASHRHPETVCRADANKLGEGGHRPRGCGRRRAQTAPPPLLLPSSESRCYFCDHARMPHELHSKKKRMTV